MKKIIEFLRIISSTLKNRSGMALAETLVAIAILGASGAAFATALSTGSLAVNNQDTVATAQALAQTQLEVLQNTTYDSSGNSYTAIITPIGYTVSITANSAIYGDANIQKISVGVSHNSSQVYVLQGYKVNR